MNSLEVTISQATIEFHGLETKKKREPYTCFIIMIVTAVLGVITQRCVVIYVCTDRKSYLPEQKVKLYMYQLCKSIYHMHRNGIFHRDVKPENILIKVGVSVCLSDCLRTGMFFMQENVLKLADFGSCKSVYSKQPYTEYISTRW